MMLDALRDYFDGRLRELRHAVLATPADREAAAVALVREALRLVLKVLEKELGKHLHYELSVFANRDAPYILAYTDSASTERPRSEASRRDNPQYYRQKKYKVVELLDYPRTDIQFVPDTHDPASGYALTPEQQAKIGSTFLYCFDTQRPAALVATCKERNTFVPGKGVLEDLLRAVGLAIRGELELAAKLAAAAPPPPPPPSSPSSPSPLDPRRARDEWAYAWIHLSDIHFGAGTQTHRYSLGQVARAVVADIAHHAPPVDAVLVTGDIAFKAAASEYADAAAWLAKVAAAARLGKDAFYFVPGNHDVDRARAGANTVAALHQAARQHPEKLDDYLADPATTAHLAPKLAAYGEFVATHYPDHPAAIDWHVVKERRVAAHELRLRLVGMSTVWLSDKLDGKHAEDDPVFEPNLAVSRHQLEAALAGAADDELVLLLTHHPAEWLEEKSRQLLHRYLHPRPHVHLCGHVHRKMTRFEHQLGRPGASVRLLAGATHDEDHALAEHTYAWGAIRRRHDRWELGWAPRVYVPERDAMRADRLRYDLGDEGFAWAPLT